MVILGISEHQLALWSYELSVFHSCNKREDDVYPLRQTNTPGIFFSDKGTVQNDKTRSFSAVRTVPDIQSPIFKMSEKDRPRYSFDNNLCVFEGDDAGFYYRALGYCAFSDIFSGWRLLHSKPAVWAYCFYHTFLPRRSPFVRQTVCTSSRSNLHTIAPWIIQRF